ncbi:uncharacterized protein [Nicotiana sylvestris]|uniref:uncharacterized protein n=1 Tax=Nicotiana sylvestris TaxID=4096 RepID=UPI00388C619F
MNLNRAKAELVVHHKVVEAFWKQKANPKWQLKGDENTKYFHSVVRGKRKLLNIHRINVDGQWVEGRDNIAIAAVNFYQDLFNSGNLDIDMSIMNCIPRLISDDDNIMLLAEPSQEEVRNAIFFINPNSSAGPDGFNSLFFQKTWDIIGDDMVNMVRVVFNSDQIPRFFTNTCLVLIPKIDSS